LDSWQAVRAKRAASLQCAYFTFNVGTLNVERYVALKSRSLHTAQADISQTRNEAMHILTTIGPDNATNAVLPFIAGKGAMGRGETVAMFAMQEATYLGAPSHADLSEFKAPGLPTVREVLDALRDNDALAEFVVCKPCAEVRGISEADLAPWATFGGADDLARQAAAYDTTMTF
jgi:predicted peroxiredoxin